MNYNWYMNRNNWKFPLSQTFRCRKQTVSVVVDCAADGVVCPSDVVVCTINDVGYTLALLYLFEVSFSFSVIFKDFEIISDSFQI